MSLVLQILLKNERNQFDLRYHSHYVKKDCLVLWKNWKHQKRHFEIKWPLPTSSWRNLIRLYINSLWKTKTLQMPFFLWQKRSYWISKKDLPDIWAIVIEMVTLKQCAEAVKKTSIFKFKQLSWCSKSQLIVIYVRLFPLCG